MTRYRITAPDGAVYEVDAPEGASEQDAIAYLQANHGSKPQAFHNSVGRIPKPNPSAANATDGMSTGERFAAGVGKSLVDTYRGLQQGGAAVGDFISPREHTLSGLITGADRSRYGEMTDTIDEQRKIDANLMDTDAGLWGNVAGVAGQILIPGGGAVRYGSMAPKAAAIVRAATLPKTILGAGTQGAVLGLLQPTGSDESHLRNAEMGGGLGLLGAAIPRVAGGLLNMVKRPLAQMTNTGVNQRVASVLRSEAENPAALMRPQPSIIPGVQRTLAEETLDPGIARLERNARSTGRGFDSIDRANNAARVAAIEAFAGDDAAIAAAKAARAQASNTARRDAMKIDGVDTSRLLSQIQRLANGQEGRPAVQSGLLQVKNMLTREVPEAERKKLALAPLQAFAAGRASSADFEAAKEAMTAIRRGEKPSGQFASQAGQDALKQAQKAFKTEAVGHDKVAVLDNVRKTMGDMLGGKYGGDSAASLAGSRELMAVKNQMDRVLAKQAPVYGQYLDAFRNGSKPINRMQIGQELLGSRSGSAIPDPVTGKQVLTPAAFSRNARNLDGIAADATGFRKAKARGLLEPQDFTAIGGVQDDLERRAFAATAGSGGNSQTFERGALQDRLGMSLLGKTPIIGPAADYLNQVGQRRLQNKLAEVLANPAQARSILAGVPEQDRRILVTALSRSGGLLGAASPAFSE